jgi:hypothetical protein
MVKIHEILVLKNFGSFRLIAGANGLDRMISIGGFIDHESVEELKESNLKNQMIFSNLPMIKGHPEEIVNYVEALILAQTECFALKTNLFKEFPEEAIELANKHDYPLFLFDEIFMDQLIRDVDQVVNLGRLLAKKIEIIEKIQSGKLSSYEIKNCAYEMNRYFKERIMVCLMKRSETNTAMFDIKTARTILGKNASIIPIDDTYMVIYSSHDEDIEENTVIQKLGLKPENYHIGVSTIANDLGLLGQLINESRTALKYAFYKDESVISYKSIGIYQILIPLLDQPAYGNFYHDMVEKIHEYDKLHQSDLFTSAVAYINSDGDIKKTAELLYQHVNTVRYRIRKLKSILELENYPGMQYETLALAIHLYELDKNRYKLNLL